MSKKRNYTQETVRKLQGSLQIEHTLAKRGAYKLRDLLENEPYVNTLGAYNGQMAVQHAKAGLKAIYLSGCQVANFAEFLSLFCFNRWLCFESLEFTSQRAQLICQ